MDAEGRILARAIFTSFRFFRAMLTDLRSVGHACEVPLHARRPSHVPRLRLRIDSQIIPAALHSSPQGNDAHVAAPQRASGGPATKQCSRQRENPPRALVSEFPQCFLRQPKAER